MKQSVLCSQVGQSRADLVPWCPASETGGFFKVLSALIRGTDEGDAGGKCERLFLIIFSFNIKIFLSCCIKSGRPVEHCFPWNSKTACLAATASQK